MKIIKAGKTIPFICSSCDCEFAVGINVVNTPDNGGNYYANCPVCGAECHTDWGKIPRDKEEIKQ